MFNICKIFSSVIQSIKFMLPNSSKTAKCILTKFYNKKHSINENLVANENNEIIHQILILIPYLHTKCFLIFSNFI